MSCPYYENTGYRDGFCSAIDNLCLGSLGLGRYFDCGYYIERHKEEALQKQRKYLESLMEK